MLNRILSQRYAKAIFQLDPQGSFDHELIALSNALHGNSIVMQAMLDPMVQSEIKLNAVRNAMGKVPEYFERFLVLLHSKRRLNCLPDILSEYLALRSRKNGMVKGKLVSSIPLDQDQVTRLEKQISSQIALNCTLETSVDTKLIGGFTIQIEDTVYDCSVKSQLEGLRNRFLNLAG